MPAWLALAALVASDVGWERRLSGLGIGEAPSARVLEGCTAVSMNESRGPRRAWVETGLLAALNRVGAAPVSSAGALEPQSLATTWICKDPRSSMTIALDASGRVSAALARVPVPVDQSADRRDAWSPERLAPLKNTVRALGAYGIRVSERDARGNALGWSARHNRGRLDAWYAPTQDLITILLHR